MLKMVLRERTSVNNDETSYTRCFTTRLHYMYIGKYLHDINGNWFMRITNYNELNMPFPVIREVNYKF